MTQVTTQVISNASRFLGVWVDTLVPLQEDLSIDHTKLVTHVRNLSAKGLENFVLFGQAGEGSAFAADEKLAAIEHLLAAGLEVENILLGVQSSSFTEVAQFVRKAHAKGIQRFLVSPPQYGQSFGHIALFEYFEQMIKQVALSDWQLFIHQLGGANHATDLPEATLADLRKTHPHVFVGIVDQDVHVNHTVDLIRSFGAQVAVASCHEPNLTILKPSVCVSALANIIPNNIQHIIANDIAHNGTKIAGMKEVKPDDRVVELMALVGDHPPIATLKLLLSQHYRMEGWQRVRPPQSRLSKEASQVLLATFKSFNLQADE